MRLWSVAALVLWGCVSENPSEPDDDDGSNGSGGEGGTGDAGAAGGDEPGGEPRLVVEPTSLNFGVVPAFQTFDKTLEVRNDGDGTLILEQVRLNGDPTFSPLVDGTDVRLDPSALGDGIAPAEALELTVRFTPADLEQARAELVIASNDPERPSVNVELFGNRPSACIAVEPPAIDFPGVPPEDTSTTTLIVRSCGQGALEVASIRLGEGSFGAFTIGDLALPLRLAPQGEDGDLVRVEVRFRPPGLDVYRDVLAIQSDDPLHPVIEVSLLGRGEEADCPIAAATEARIVAAPLDTITLDGSPSIPSGDEAIAFFEWTIVAKPEASAISLADDDPTTPTVEITLDAPGDYSFELSVTDTSGRSSTDCGLNAQVEVSAARADDLRIELGWTTPGDADPDDAFGADLDLHLLHPFAESWFAEPYDCYYENFEADWGMLDVPDDDPRLSEDATDGRRPEIITLNSPEDTQQLGAPYRVGVHYRDDRHRQTNEPFGPSEATVRIYVRGGLALEATREMLEQDDFWYAASIDWSAADSADVELTDQYYDERP